MFIREFSSIRMTDVSSVGGKNASLGELFNVFRPQGVGVLDGFAVTAEAYRMLLATAGLEQRLRKIFEGLDVENVEELSSAGHAARSAVLDTALPPKLRSPSRPQRWSWMSSARFTILV